MMSHIRYVAYKMLSVLLIRLKTFRVFPIVRVTDLNISRSKSFYFDFSDVTTHLGDRLFFMPLVSDLLSRGFLGYINSKDNITRSLFENILDQSLPFKDAPDVDDIVVYPAPSYLNFRKNYSKAILVDFTDCDAPLKVSNQLVLSISNFAYPESQRIQFIPFSQMLARSQYLQNKSIPKSYLFNNYIDSGRFRKLFINEKKLFEKAADLRENGFKIIHIGSKEDKDRDAKKYPFVDIDLRGETSIRQLIDIVQSENVIGAVTYDNFLMHLIGMYGKVAYVLFRGRFSQKNREHHMLRVNNTFFEKEENLIYL